MQDPRDTGDFKMDVARRLKVTRVAMGLNQNEIASSISIGRTNYNQFETGARTLTLKAAMAICDRYGLTLDWLYRGDRSGLRNSLFEAIRNAEANLDDNKTS